MEQELCRTTGEKDSAMRRAGGTFLQDLPELKKTHPHHSALQGFSCVLLWAFDLQSQPATYKVDAARSDFCIDAHFHRANQRKMLGKSTGQDWNECGCEKITRVVPVSHISYLSYVPMFLPAANKPCRVVNS